MIISDKAVLKHWVEALNEINVFVKEQENPLYNSKYTDLSAIVETIDPILAKHGFKVVQEIINNGADIGVVTIAMHVSGDTIATNALYAMPVPNKSGVITPHAIGSTITYLRRYSLMAFIGQASKNDDDDGNAGSDKGINTMEFYSGKINQATTMEDLTSIWKEISSDSRVETSEIKALSMLIKSAKIKVKGANPDEVS